MLAELFGSAEIRDIIVSERMKVYEASFNFDLDNAPDYRYFLNIINFIPQRDNIKIILQDENERIFEISSSKTEGEEEYKKFLQLIKKEFLVRTHELFRFHIIQIMM